MYCGNCGTELVEGKCPTCGYIEESDEDMKMIEVEVVEEDVVPEPEGVNAVAIVGFVTSILAALIRFPIVHWLANPILMLIGLICSSVGAGKANITGKGKAFSIVGLVVSIVYFVMIAAAVVLALIAAIIAIVLFIYLIVPFFRLVVDSGIGY